MKGMGYYSMNITSVNDIIRDIATQTEEKLLEQLNWLVKRGILVIHHRTPTLVQDLSSDKLIIRNSVELVVKDKEYIESLEKENVELKEQLRKINEAVRLNV